MKKQKKALPACLAADREGFLGKDGICKRPLITGVGLYA